MRKGVSARDMSLSIGQSAVVTAVGGEGALRRRLHLTRTMQILGVTSLFLCVVTMFMIYIGLSAVSAYVFGVALVCLIGSLGVSIREIQISVRALDLHLHDMEER